MRVFFFICVVSQTLLFGCAAIKIPKNYFKNKTLVYSSSNGNTGIYTFNSYFINRTKDSLYQVDYPYGFVVNNPNGVTKKISNSGDTILKPMFFESSPFANPSYTLYKKKKSIYISYRQENNLEKKKIYYSLNKFDTTIIYDLKNICTPTPINKGLAVFTGRDTLIRLNELRLKCWVFSEVYLRRIYNMNNLVRSVYIEKKSLMPILIIEQQYSDDLLIQKSGKLSEYKLNFVVPIDTSKYRISSCIENLKSTSFSQK